MNKIEETELKIEFYQQLIKNLKTNKVDFNFLDRMVIKVFYIPHIKYEIESLEFDLKIYNCMLRKINATI